MTNQYLEHLKTEALKVIEGDVAFDTTHPYCYSIDFLRVLSSELNLLLEDLVLEEEYEQCVTVRDALEDINKLYRNLKESAPPIK